jgi:hypothetical protein
MQAVSCDAINTYLWSIFRRLSLRQLAPLSAYFYSVEFSVLMSLQGLNVAAFTELSKLLKSNISDELCF